MYRSRQRMLDAFNFNRPDKIPVVYHPSTAGLYIHGQKLIDLFNQYPSDNPITFKDIPKPEKETFNKDGNFLEYLYYRLLRKRQILQCSKILNKIIFIISILFVLPASGFALENQNTIVKEIIIVMKTHFDIGYTDYASEVVQSY